MSFFDQQELAQNSAAKTPSRPWIGSLIPGLDSFWDKRLPGRSPEPETKFDKEPVNYRLSSSEDKGNNCLGCAYYRAPLKCELVRGVIYLRGVCDKFEAKTASTGNNEPVIP